TTKRALDREGRVGASTTQVFVLGVTFAPSVQGKRQQADRVDDIRLAAIVFSHEDGHVLGELDCHVGTRTKPLDLECVETHRLERLHPAHRWLWWLTNAIMHESSAATSHREQTRVGASFSQLGSPTHHSVAEMVQHGLG